MTRPAGGSRPAAGGLSSCTILIVARNASATIARAVRSACAQEPSAILLVDDASDDDTIEAARSAAGERLHVTRLETHRTVGHARGVGLSAVQTPYAIWLDADDEMLAGRSARLIARLEAEQADIATDSVELIDQVAGASQGESRIPPFLFRPPGVVRLFERNYLPAPGPIAFRVDALRQIGYDVGLQGAEDMDVLLRAIASGLRVALVDEIGYRLYTSPRSLSRDMANQRAMLRVALAKHSYENVERLYVAHGASPYVACWGLVWLAMFRADWSAALTFLDRVAQIGLPLATVVEPDGPCPRIEAWRQNFQRGTLLLMVGRPLDACLALASADAAEPTPESANNLGVALFRTGREAAAHKAFARALDRWPGYVDASHNLASREPGRITTHPLRVHRARADYPA